MSETLSLQKQAPEWIRELFHEIDTLEFGSGFSHLNENTVMEFGTATIRGVQSIQEFFVKIDSPLEIEHRIHAFWDGGSTKILKGDARLRKKGSSDPFTTTPLMQIFYMSGGESVARWFIVNGPIQTDKVL